MQVAVKPIIVRLKKTPVLVDSTYSYQLLEFIKSKKSRISQTDIMKRLNLKRTALTKKLNGLEKFTEEEKKIISEYWHFDVK